MTLAEQLEARTTALTVGEVATILNVSERQIYKLAALNELPCLRVGGAVRFEPSAIADWIRRSSAPGKFAPQSVHAPRYGRRRA